MQRTWSDILRETETDVEFRHSYKKNVLKMNQSSIYPQRKGREKQSWLAKTEIYSAIPFKGKKTKKQKTDALKITEIVSDTCCYVLSRRFLKFADRKQFISKTENIDILLISLDIVINLKFLEQIMKALPLHCLFLNRGMINS